MCRFESLSYWRNSFFTDVNFGVVILQTVIMLLVDVAIVDKISCRKDGAIVLCSTVLEQLSTNLPYSLTEQSNYTMCQYYLRCLSTIY